MFELGIALLIVTVLAPMAGVGLGRIIILEDLFAPLRERIQEGPYQTITDIDGRKHFLFPREGSKASHMGQSPRRGTSWFFAGPDSATAYQAEVPDPEIADETMEVLCLGRPNRYLPGVLGYLRGVIGSLLSECALCLGLQITLWLSIFGVACTFWVSAQVAVLVVGPLGALGFYYMLHGLIGKQLDSNE